MDLPGTKTALAGWQTNTFILDTQVTANTAYYYWIRAAASSSGDRASDYSFFALGSSTEAPRPQLSAFIQTGSFVLSWPTNWSGFSVEYATNLPCTNWLTVPLSPSIVNGQFVLTNELSGPQRFFRLRQ
jgi:hypothetical protein